LVENLDEIGFMKNTSRILTAQLLLLSTAAFALTACGAGSSNSSSGGSISPPSPPVSNAPTYTVGVFEASSRFKDRCEVVRTGTDSEGNSFPDISGSTLEENHWLRSWSNETYLWNREIEDQNPANFSSPVSYFAELKTFATTASGEDRDDFHFSQPTADFLESRNNTPTSGYGARFRAFKSSAPNRDFRVLYTEADSPASEVVNGEVQFPRGARILEVDGEDLLNGNDTTTLNNGLFPATAGEAHTFKIREADGTERTVTLVSEDIAAEPVNRIKVINTPTGNVGYMLFNTFSPFASEKSLADGITALSNQGVNDFVLDLRYNGGGLLAVSAQLGYMVAGPNRTAGKTAVLLQYNEDANGTDPTSSSDEPVEPIPFIDEGLGFSVPRGQPLSTLNLPRVFILSTGGTCSASEVVINSLQGIDVEVILIGDITCGKPYGFLPTGNCGETYYTIQFRSVNDKDFGDYSDGFVPNDNSFNFGVRLDGCTIPDDLSRELGDENEALLSAALHYRTNNACPTATSTKTSFKFTPPSLETQADNIDQFSIIAPEDRPENARLRNITDATMPSKK
jgi:C-terminal processing protease CtpA/Prc